MKSRAPFSKLIITGSIGCFVFLSLLFGPAILSAQDRGTVQVVKDPKVDSLIGNYLVDKKGNTHGAGLSSGFRVQIFSGSDRKEAYKAEAKFQEKYPDLRTYLTYQSPNFKVHVGDFRSRLEAEKMMDGLRPWFTGLFIIAEKINLPKLDTE
jgi:hypothetical protein